MKCISEICSIDIIDNPNFLLKSNKLNYITILRYIMCLYRGYGSRGNKIIN